MGNWAWVAKQRWVLAGARPGRPDQDRRSRGAVARLVLLAGAGLIAAAVLPASAAGAAASAGPAAAIAAGNAHACTIQAGKAYCWGSNASGQLGNGTTLQHRAGRRLYRRGAGGQDAQPDRGGLQPHLRAGHDRGRVLLGPGRASGQSGTTAPRSSGGPVAVTHLRGAVRQDHHPDRRGQRAHTWCALDPGTERGVSQRERPARQQLHDNKSSGPGPGDTTGVLARKNAQPGHRSVSGTTCTLDTSGYRVLLGRQWERAAREQQHHPEPRAGRGHHVRARWPARPDPARPPTRTASTPARWDSGGRRLLLGGPPRSASSATAAWASVPGVPVAVVTSGAAGGQGPHPDRHRLRLHLRAGQHGRGLLLGPGRRWRARQRSGCEQQRPGRGDHDAGRWPARP